MKLDRRGVLAGAGALAAGACVPLDTSDRGRLAAKLALIERSLGGQLGVAFYDPAERQSFGHRADESFAMCSTFKASLAALLLTRAGTIDIDATVHWVEGDLLSYAPFAKERLATGASLRELAQAAVTLSDNTAANLLLARLGGPEGLTAFWRSLGDETTRLDHTEPQLNFVPQGQVNDGTTPAAMSATLAKLVSGDVLNEERRAILRGWLHACRTGLTKVRAGLPQAWEAGDKTGNSGDWPGMGYARGDIGYVMFPTRDPAFFAVYHRAAIGSPPDVRAVDAAFAEVGRSLSAWMRRNYRIIPT